VHILHRYFLCSCISVVFFWVHISRCCF